jgi:hypothetical protein
MAAKRIQATLPPDLEAFASERASEIGGMSEYLARLIHFDKGEYAAGRPSVATQERKKS